MKSYYNSSVIYVSQKDGNDSNTGYCRVSDGIGNGPLKTLERAIRSIVSMRTSNLRQSVTVRIMGDYYLSDTIRLGCLDYPGYPKFNPDTPVENICFESDGNSKSRIIGGRRIDGFVPDRLNGHDCLSAEIPDVKDGKWYFTDLYVNGNRATWAKYPAQGRLRAVTTEVPHWQDTTHGSIWFVAKPGDLDGISDVEQCFVGFEHHWIDEHSSIEKYDPETGRIDMSWRSRFNISTDNPGHTSEMLYYLENTVAGFTEPGNWYLDKKNGKLYYIPREGETADTLEVYAPTIEKLFRIRGTEENKVYGLRFRNLEFFCTAGDYKAYRDVRASGLLPHEKEEEDFRYASSEQSHSKMMGAISFENAEMCSIEDCDIHGIGYHAIEILNGCHDIRIENNRITGIGSGGIKVFGGSALEPVSRRTAHITVRNNEIGDIGQRYAAGCGVLIAHAANNTIEENRIHDTYYSGISVGWVWGYNESTTYGNRICKNHIWNIGRHRLSDLGGIYCLGRQSGTVICDNVIHDVTRSVYFAEGIHADEGSSLLTIERNLIYNTGMALCLHFGEYNTVRNNIFAFADEYLIWGGAAGEAHAQLICEGNIFVQNGKPVFCNDCQSGMHSSNNLIWDTTGTPQLFNANVCGQDLNLEQWQKLYGQDELSLVADPMFADLENRDFRLSDDSPAYKIGFQKLKM